MGRALERARQTLMRSLRNFIGYVERAFEARGIRVNVLLLSPKLPETSVMRRQIIEGVLAVTKLDRSSQMTNKFQLSVFDRSQGANNVRFEGNIPIEFSGHGLMIYLQNMSISI